MTTAAEEVPPFSLQELEAYIADATEWKPPPEYRSTVEWAAIFHVSERYMRCLLEKLSKANRLKLEWRSNIGIDGRRCKTPVYAIAGKGGGRC